jgi:hypothetical protein
MSTAKKYRKYKVDTNERHVHELHNDKKAIHNLKTRIATEISQDIAKQKKAALILERLINSK